MIKLNCPYCNAVLPKEPQRKTKCKQCGRYYYKRAYPPDVNGQKFIVTEEEAKRIDKMWIEYNTRYLGYSIGDTIKNPTTELENKLYKIEEMLKLAVLLGGSIAIGDHSTTVEELEDQRERLKFEIAAEASQRKLRVIK